MLSKIFQKHKIWIDIVSSFGCNKDTAEDIVQEMYIKIQRNLNNGLDINYDDDYNYFYIFKTLKSMFLDLKRKEAKIIIAKSKLPIINKIDKLQKEVCQLKRRKN